MRALVQRVHSAKVVVEGEKVGEIKEGLLTFLGISKTDTETDVQWMIQKISKLRIFEDENGKMNLSLLDLISKNKEAGHLLVSQFTLYGDCSQGNRPSFFEAAPPEHAQKLYQFAIECSKKVGLPTQTGKFQSHMDITLVNNGPVTLWIDSND